MARQRWIQDPVTNQLIPADQWRGPSTSSASYIIPDIQPYKSMITGEMITSRSHHREHLRQHNVQEIGNEIDYAIKTARTEYKPDREHIRRQLAEVMTAKNYW